MIHNCMVLLLATLFSRVVHRVSSFQHHTTKLSTSHNRHTKHSMLKNFMPTQVVEAPNFSDFEFKQLSLNNGIIVTLVRDGQSEKSSCCLAVAVGAKDDPIEFPGMAHFTGKFTVIMYVYLV